MAKIGHAAHNEMRKVKGGKKGDQTRKEILIQAWYLHKKGWIVLRARDPEVAKKLADTMVAICKNDHFGYGQDYRLSGFNEAKKHDFDVSKVDVNCGLDCSETVRVCLWSAGIKVEDFRTRTQLSVIKKTGAFEVLTLDKYCKSSKHLKRGDILLTKEVPGHTAIVTEEDDNMTKVFLSAGHGGSDPGAVSYGMKEKDINLATLKACRDELERHGVKVICSREKDVNDPVADEVKEANASGADVAVSFHINAGGGDGFEAFYYTTSKDGKKLAQLGEKYVKALGQNSRGIKSGNHLYFVKKTKMTAVLFESFFVDNDKDNNIGDTAAEQKAFGVAYAKAILEYLGIKYKAPAAVEKEPAKEEPAKGKLYRVQVGSYGAKANAEAMQKKLKAAGFEAVIVEV